MIFADQYISSAARMVEAGVELGGRPGATLIRLAGVYLSYIADGLEPANDNKGSGALERTKTN